MPRSLLRGRLFSSATTPQSQLESRDAEVCRNRGMARQRKNQSDLAISDFSKALEIDPKLAEANYRRAIAHFFMEEYDESWGDVIEAQKLGYQIPSGFLDDLRKASGSKKL